MTKHAEERRDAILVLWGFDPSEPQPKWLIERAKQAVTKFDETGTVPPRPVATSDQSLAMLLYKHRLVIKRGKYLCICDEMLWEDDYETHLVAKIREAGWHPEKFNNL